MPHVPDGSKEHQRQVNYKQIEKLMSWFEGRGRGREQHVGGPGLVSAGGDAALRRGSVPGIQRLVYAPTRSWI